MQVLAPDVVFIADGGGLAPAARIPVQGADRVGKFNCTSEPEGDCNGGGDHLAQRRTRCPNRDRRQLAVISLVVEDGLVTQIFAVANPRKLTRLSEPAELAR